MRQLTSADKGELIGWLNAQSKLFSGHLKLLYVLGCARFFVAASALYLLAVLLAAAVIEAQKPRGEYLLALASLLALQVILQLMIDRKKLQLAAAIVHHYQQKIWLIVQQGSLAVIRDYTLAAWQSFFMQRVPALQAYFSDYLPQQRIAVRVPSMVLAFVFPHSWLAALLLAIAAPLIPLFMWLVGMGAASAQRKHFLALERLGSVFLDRLSARQLLHVHNAVTAQKKVFQTAAQQLRKRSLEVLQLAFLSSSVLDFFATVGIALVAVFVGFSLLGELQFGSWQNGLDLSQGLFILLLAPLFFSELKTLGRYYHLRAQAIGAADTLQHLLDNTPIQPVKSSSEFKVVNFSLHTPQHQTLLHAPLLCLRQGDRILLQGSSGSGKTTLLEALLGMRPNQCNLNEYLPWQNLAWLGQQAPVLPGTVRENISLGHPATDKHLHQLLEKVELQQWLQHLPAGLNTTMGEYPPLSGGQRQRLAIARLLFFDKPIVFLDEPSANLASEQAERITALLKQCFQEKTLIWISHDLAGNNYFTARWNINSATGLLSVDEERKLCA
ncbi:ATP-binding cassette, subfamily C, CydD [Alteromonadaceae bacterium Bs31]|nr:ATP-binding cassette, subfamily C, CydD [Alteromonadaceae bacterium Bs31]